MTLNIDEILELKKYLESKKAVPIHLHDACGGQYFTLDTADENTVNIIKDYFKKKNISASFSANNDSFTIGGLSHG